MFREILLDLDNTLLESVDEGEKICPDLPNRYKIFEFTTVERPYLQLFLDYLFTNYQVGVWTAATEEYAEAIIRALITRNTDRKLTRVLARKFTDECDDKRLKALGDEANRMLIIDDRKAVWKLNPNNCYKIPAFRAGAKSAAEDYELLRVIEFLDKTRTLGEKNDSAQTDLSSK